MSRRSSEETRRGPKSRRQRESYVFNSEEALALLMDMIIGMSLAGGAIRVGLTRDGGALAVGLYKGEEYGTEYIRPNEDLEMSLREIVIAWEIPLALWDEEADQYTKR